MPFENFGPYRIVVADYGARDIIWPMLSEKYINAFGTNEIFDQSEVDRGLKFVFSTLIEIFDERIKQNPSASFFMFTHTNNESLTSLMFDQYNGYKINHQTIRPDDLAVDRRVSKIILEQYTAIEMTHTEPIDIEILKYSDRYEALLGELLYIGSYIYFIKYLISQNAFFAGAISLLVKKDNGFFAFITHSPFREVLDAITIQFKLDAEYINNHPYENDLYKILGDELNISPTNAINILNNDDILDEFSYIDLHKVVYTLNQKFNYPVDSLWKFYSGFILSKENKLSIENSFLRNQDNNRYLYRPIIQISVNGAEYYKYGAFKYIESYRSLIYNSLPYGHLPKEWLNIKKIRNFMGMVQNKHDEVLENPLCEMLSERRILFDRNIKSLMTENKSNNLKVDIEDVGEIDIIYLLYKSNKFQVIVCECKNNRFRDDFYNWQRDYSNFVQTYENQLNRKVKFIQNHLPELIQHFKRLYHNTDIDFSIEVASEVKGEFLINAPSLYMYDGAYDVYNYKTFPEYLDGEYVRTVFMLKNEDNNSTMRLEYPYFRNLRKLNNMPNTASLPTAR